jgi:glycosyltransferase involved in cell wall biosynthesis
MISVVITVYNGAEFITAAIRSVLRQTLAPEEVIVVDDGSTDGSVDIVADFQPALRLLRQPRKGVAAALNAGIAESRGEYIAFLDGDDLWAEEKLARQSAALRSNAQLDAVFGQMVQFTDLDYKVAAPGDIKQMSKAHAGVHKCAMLIRRAAFDRVGPFDPNTVGDFPEWYARAVSMGIRTQILEEVVVFRRRHRKNDTLLRRKEFHRSYLKIARSLIAQRDSRSRN